MIIDLCAVGRLKEAYFLSAQDEYRKRLRSYCRLQVREFRTEKELLAGVPASAHVYAMDERGELWTSREFCQHVLEHEQLYGGGAAVVVAIGGADGWGEPMRQRARRLVSFGRMTVGHRVMRVVVLEQLYRAFKIQRGEPYHREG